MSNSFSSHCKLYKKNVDMGVQKTKSEVFLHKINFWSKRGFSTIKRNRKNENGNHRSRSLNGRLNDRLQHECIIDKFSLNSDSVCTSNLEGGMGPMKNGEMGILCNSISLPLQQLFNIHIQYLVKLWVYTY